MRIKNILEHGFLIDAEIRVIARVMVLLINP